MPIKHHELLELFVETIMDASTQDITLDIKPGFGEQVDSYFEPPSLELLDKVQTLTTLYGSNASLMQALAEDWSEQGADGAAHILTIIEQFINENDLDVDKKPVKRIVDYVYTVV
jgi:hypothetical protein